MKTKYNKNYKNRVRVRKAQYSKENGTKKNRNQNQRAVLPRIWLTYASSDNSDGI